MTSGSRRKSSGPPVGEKAVVCEGPRRAAEVERAHVPGPAPEWRTEPPITRQRSTGTKSPAESGLEGLACISRLQRLEGVKVNGGQDVEMKIPTTKILPNVDVGFDIRRDADK